MSNLPIRGESSSLDNLAVTREEFRVGMGTLLEYLAQALGGVPGAYLDEAVDPLAVLLQGEPSLDPAAVPDPDDDSERLISSAWARANLVDGGQKGGFRNRIINGGFIIDQHNAGAPLAIPANTPMLACDRYWVSSTGAGVTSQRQFVTSLGEDTAHLSVSGAPGVTKIGIFQRVERVNCFHLRGQQVTLSVRLSNSFQGTVRWRLYHANTPDTFGSVTVPTKVQLDTGTWTGVTSTFARFVAPPIDLPDIPINGLEVVLEVENQTAGVFGISQLQLEPGAEATPFEWLNFSTELAHCQRYFQWIPYNIGGATPFVNVGFENQVTFPVPMRVSPTVGALGADGVQNPQGSNWTSAGVQRVTPLGGTIYGIAPAVGGFFFVGFRASANAEIG